jgi:RNA polymerase sigma-70 factor, ECF subfamily
MEDRSEQFAEERISACAAFDRIAIELYRFVAVRMNGDTHTADDIMQQLWVKARTQSHVMDHDHAERWLRHVAANMVNETWRRSQRDPATRPCFQPKLAAWLAERINREPLPAERIEQDDVRQQLLLALTALPAEEQRVLVERYVEERSLQEIADRRSTTERSIEGRLYRARRQLKAMLLKADDGCAKEGTHEPPK